MYFLTITNRENLGINYEFYININTKNCQVSDLGGVQFKILAEQFSHGNTRIFTDRKKMMQDTGFKIQDNTKIIRVFQLRNKKN
jgi:hypothetical protein